MSFTLIDEQPGRRFRRWALARPLQRARALILPALLICIHTQSASAAIDLAPLLAAPGTTVTLNGGSIYSIGQTALSTNKTLLCNGATIQVSVGPLRAASQG